MIDANASASWLVVMNAQTVGEKDATFEVDYDGGSATIALTAVSLRSERGQRGRLRCRCHRQVELLRV